MIKQDFVLDPSSPDVKGASSRGANGHHRNGSEENGRQYVWEVRHVGLLGIKYEVAVRSDLVEEQSVKIEEVEGMASGKDVLRGVVDAAVLG